MSNGSTIKRYCYPRDKARTDKSRRVWWWEIVPPADGLVIDGFSSKREAVDFATRRGIALA